MVTHDSGLARSVDQMLELKDGRLRGLTAPTTELRGVDGRASRA
jgi:hypothetical protein